MNYRETHASCLLATLIFDLSTHQGKQSKINFDCLEYNIKVC